MRLNVASRVALALAASSALLLNAGCQGGFVCEPDRPDDNGMASGPGCPGTPETPQSTTAPTEAEMTAYQSMSGPHPPSDYALPAPSSVQVKNGKVTHVVYRGKDGSVIARGMDTDGDGVIDTYTKYSKGRAQSQTRDTDGNGTLDLRYTDVDGDGRADTKDAYPVLTPATDPAAADAEKKK